MKVFLVGLTIAAAVVGGGIGYASLQTGVAPVWQRPGETASDADSPRSDAADESDVARALPDVISESIGGGREAPMESNERAQTRTSVPAGPNDVVITEADLNQMVNAALAADTTIAPILDRTDGVETKLEDGRIESGITLNINDLPLEELPVEVGDAVAEMTKTFPFLVNRPIYLGIEGSPNVVEGEISLDDANVKFGPLKLPASSVASQLGVSQTDIEKQLNQVIEQQGLTPEDIQIVDGQIVVTGL